MYMIHKTRQAMGVLNHTLNPPIMYLSWLAKITELTDVMMERNTILINNDFF